MDEQRRRRRRRVRLLQRYVLNPPMKVLAWAGLVPGKVLVETTGRRSGKRRRNVVGMLLEGDTGWVVAEQGRHAGYVRNLEANPDVRVRLRRSWCPARAQVVDGDDVRARLEAFRQRSHAAAVRRFGTDLTTVRFDFPAPPTPRHARAQPHDQAGRTRTLAAMLGRHRGTGVTTSRARSFDPNRVGTWEWRAWVAYYRRRWATVLVASVGLVRAGFGMSWPRTLHGAWLVLRANQRWAPFPDNDPEGARRLMESFYRLVAEAEGDHLDVVEASRREVEWWRVHRERQRGDRASAADGEGEGEGPLVDALVDLYSLVYDCEPAAVRPAAALRAKAMDVSDQWVREGCDTESALLGEERALLVRSYAALLAAVHR